MEDAMLTSVSRISFAGQPHPSLVAGIDDLLTMAVDCLRQGVILVDHSSHIVFANREARTIVAACDGLYDGPTGLRAETLEATRRLRRLVEVATAAAVAPSVMALPRRVLPHPLSVLVSPLRADAALVLIIDPDRAAAPWPDQLRRLYGLTDAEAAVAMALIGGDGLAVAAAKLGIGQTTVRTHLQHVFQKTGTCRQAQLVRLIMAGCLGLCI
jgi:DNA-binding CsgD family transcriptional regulator